MDKALALLLSRLPSGRGLWLAGEESSDLQAAQLSGYSGLTLLTNRINLVLQKPPLDAFFCDFVLPPEVDSGFDYALVRVSKEKAVTHCQLNLASRHLKTGGELLVCGHKGEGIKSYFANTGRYLTTLEREKHTADLWFGRFRQDAGALDLDSRDYSQIRQVAEYEQYPIFSKPGVFGWDKLDKGSQMLAQCLAEQKPQAKTVLDLGCGYGLLTLAAVLYCTPQRLLATDNNAAAIQAYEYNLREWRIKADVRADDCASGVAESFDLILCNPPFHTGFQVDSELGSRFIDNARRLCKPRGQALFVVNGFLPLEQAARRRFNQVEVIASDRSFKVVQMRP